MDMDDSIAQLGRDLDGWFDANFAALTSEDRAAQGEALLRGIEILKELERLKAKGLASLATLLNQHDMTTQEERAASLVRGFEFGAKLAHALSDELSDTTGYSQVVRLTDAIAKALDTIGSGRVALAGLLDHSDVGVRASVGEQLIDLMPERVVPILREIEERRDGSSALFMAHWALLAWKLEGK
jgi:hypothetical protein